MTRATPQPESPATHAGLRATPRRYSIRTTGTAAKRAEGTRPPSGRYDCDHMEDMGTILLQQSRGSGAQWKTVVRSCAWKAWVPLLDSRGSVRSSATEP